MMYDLSMSVKRALIEIAIFLPVFLVIFHICFTLIGLEGTLANLIDSLDYYPLLQESPDEFMSSILAAITATGVAYLFYRLVRWIASTVKKAGK